MDYTGKIKKIIDGKELKDISITNLQMLKFYFEKNSSNQEFTQNGITLELIEDILNKKTILHDKTVEERNSMNKIIEENDKRIKVVNEKIENFKNILKLTDKKENQEALNNIIKYLEEEVNTLVELSKYYEEYKNNLIKDVTSLMFKGGSVKGLDEVIKKTPLIPDNKKPQNTPQPQTTIAKFSIIDYVNKGVLPNNIEINKLVSIANSLGIKANDPNYVLNFDELNRLKDDKAIKLAFNNEKIKDLYNKQLSSFEKINDKFQELKNQINIDSRFIDKIDKDQEKVNKHEDSIQEKIDNIKSNTVKEVFTNQYSMASARSEVLDIQSEKINDKLREQYKVLDERQEERKNAQGKIRKTFSDIRIQRTMKRIKKLKEKQSFCLDKQMSIMNKEAKKYIERQRKQLENYINKQKKVEKNIETAKQYDDKIKKSEEIINTNKQDLAANTSNKIDAKAERMANKAIISYNTKKIAMLEIIKELRIKTGNLSMDQLSFDFTQKKSL